MSLSLRYRLMVAVLVPMLLVAACGGGEEKADGSSKSDSSTGKDSSSAGSSTGSNEPGDGSTPAQFSCDKVTAAEIGELLGSTYTFKLGPQDQCDFDPSDPATSPTAYITIDQFKSDFPTFKGANPGATDVDVAMGGFIADDPNAKSLKNGYAKITADGVTLHVTLAGGDEADRNAKIEELLKLAVSKL